MNAFDAWYLPGLDADAITDWRILEHGDVTLRVPALGAGDVTATAERLRNARQRVLQGRPLNAIIAAIDRAARELEAGGGFRDEAERLLPAVTRYSLPMARLVLDRMAADWRRGPLETLVELELGSQDRLDGFCNGTGRALRHAVGPPLTFHVFAGNVPGVAVTSLVRALLVRSASLAKTAADEPVLPVLFARALAATDPELADCIAITYWPGAEEEALARAAAEEADAVVVYGGDAVARTTRRMVPRTTTFILHGPKVSFGIVGRDALARDRVETTARAVARATAVFDQHGCVSPHVVYVEAGAETGSTDFAAAVSAALEDLEKELPRGDITTREAAAIRQLRGAAEFRELAGGDVRVHAGSGTRHTVIHDADPSFTPSCLNRTLWVRRVDDADRVPPLLAPYRHVLQSAALDGLGHRTESIARLLARAGVSRITDFQRLPWPAPHDLHDGRGPLRELLRWAQLET